MGYTHYFAYDPYHEAFIAGYPQMVDDARRIVSHIDRPGVRIRSWSGKGAPEFDASNIAFNGTAAGDMGHESFVIDTDPRKSWEHPENAGTMWARHERAQYERIGAMWCFCKTARKPYDVAVGAVLLRCAQIAPTAFVIASDGQWDREWAHGCDHWSDDRPKSKLSARNVVRELFGSDVVPGFTGAPFVDTTNGLRADAA